MDKKVPMRRCIFCYSSKPKEELIRLVNRDGEILVDFENNQPGRGFYICRSEDCFINAQNKNLFSKTCKRKVSEDESEKLRKVIFCE